MVYYFGVAKGDTFSLINFGVPSKNEVIVSKELIKMRNGSERNLFNKRCIGNNDTSQNTYWIEGIGDISNPFTSESFCSLFDPTFFVNLLQFIFEDKVIYEKKEKLKFIDPNSIWMNRYVAFTANYTNTNRTKFSLEAKMIDNRKYYELLKSETENGNDFKPTGDLHWFINWEL